MLYLKAGFFYLNFYFFFYIQNFLFALRVWQLVLTCNDCFSHSTLILLPTENYLLEMPILQLFLHINNTFDPKRRAILKIVNIKLLQLCSNLYKLLTYLWGNADRLHRDRSSISSELRFASGRTTPLLKSLPLRNNFLSLPRRLRL